MYCRVPPQELVNCVSAAAFPASTFMSQGCVSGQADDALGFMATYSTVVVRVTLYRTAVLPLHCTDVLHYCTAPLYCTIVLHHCTAMGGRHDGLHGDVHDRSGARDSVPQCTALMYPI